MNSKPLACKNRNFGLSACTFLDLTNANLKKGTTVDSFHCCGIASVLQSGNDNAHFLKAICSTFSSETIDLEATFLRCSKNYGDKRVFVVLPVFVLELKERYA